MSQLTLQTERTRKYQFKNPSISTWKMSDNRKVILLPGGADNDKIQVSRKAAEMSNLIADMLREDEDDEPEIPLPNVQRVTLEKVVEFCEKHAEDPMPRIVRPIKSADMVEVVGEWDAKFIDLEQTMLFNVILAANYLDLSDLLDLGCAKIASMIKGKTPDEIKDLFHIEKNATPEEEDQIKKENQWIFEVN